MSNSTTSMSFSSLTKTANEWRKTIVSRVWDGINGTEIQNAESLSMDFMHVASSQTEMAFSNGDIDFFGRLYRDKEVRYTEQRDELIRIIHSGNTNPLMMAEMKKASFLVRKCGVMLSFLREEYDRRVAEGASRQEAEKAEAQARLDADKARLEADKAEHQAWLNKQRAKYYGPKIPNHAPHADRLVGKGLEALATIKEDRIVTNRKAGKFETEVFIKKAEVSAIVGDLTVLTAGQIYTLPDFRQIDVVKKGAITRYLLKA